MNDGAAAVEKREYQYFDFQLLRSQWASRTLYSMLCLFRGGSCWKHEFSSPFTMWSNPKGPIPRPQWMSCTERCPLSVPCWNLCMITGAFDYRSSELTDLHFPKTLHFLQERKGILTIWRIQDSFVINTCINRITAVVLEFIVKPCI